ncbi:MAG: chaperonin GroES [Clostridia bacterium]|nr:chaperonin GroES [Clostridia bacterium]
MSFRPLGDRVLLKPVKAEEKTAAGIFLPDAAKERPQQGEVVAVGPGRILDNGERAELQVKVGDKVFYAKFSGTELKQGDEEYLVISERDILAVVE